MQTKIIIDKQIDNFSLRKVCIYATIAAYFCANTARIG